MIPLVYRTRTVLTHFAYFPAEYGQKYRHTPVLKLPVPQGMLAVRVEAQVEVQSKDATQNPPQFVVDERTGERSGFFCNAEIRASADEPTVVDAPHPPGILVSTLSGENVGNQLIIRPYWQPYKFGWLLGDELNGVRWLTLYVAPASAAVKYPQKAWVASNPDYALMCLEAYPKE